MSDDYATDSVAWCDDHAVSRDSCGCPWRGVVAPVVEQRLHVVSFAAMRERRIEWLVPDLLPLSEVVVTLGEEGIGKGLFWCHLIGQVTRGPAPVDVVVIVAEDSPDATVLPRLRAVGADLSRVHLITRNPDDLSGVPSIPGNTDEVAELVCQVGARLVIVDPWLSVVPGGLQVRDTQQARQALDPMTRLARTTGAAIVLVTHTNRSSSTRIRDLYGATIALRQAARIAALVLQDPADPGVLFAGVEKSNIHTPVPAARFRKTGRPGSAAWRLVEDGDLGLTMRELVGVLAQVEDGRSTDRWPQVLVAASASGGVVTRSQIVDVYADATDPAKAADKAISRWRHSDPPRLVAVHGQRGVFEVVGVSEPPTTPHHPRKSDAGGTGGNESRLPPEPPADTDGDSWGVDGGLFDPACLDPEGATA